MEVVPPAENFQVVPIWHEGFSQVVDFFRLLRLASPLAENNIALNIKPCPILHVALHSNQACFLCMLQIIAMTLGDLPIDGLFHPRNFINESKQLKDI